MHRRGFHGRRHGHYGRPFYGGFGYPYWGGWGYRPYWGGYPYYNPVLWR